jgi:hypothetical protein
LRTGIESKVLVAAAVVGVAAPIAVGWLYGGVRLLPFIVIGAVLVVGYNLELGRGFLHRSVVFATGWGAFPLLCGYYAQDFRLGLPAVIAAGAAFLLSLAQRQLSLFARSLRRHSVAVHGHIEYDDGTRLRLDRATLLSAPETALRAVAAGLVCIAVAMVAAR